MLLYRESLVVKWIVNELIFFLPHSIFYVEDFQIHTIAWHDVTLWRNNVQYMQ